MNKERHRIVGPPAGRAKPGFRRRMLVRLADGSTGYSMLPNNLDCLRAAVATVLQVPASEVPDARIVQRLRAGDDPKVISRQGWEQLARWADKRGLRMRFHETVPLPDARWIGICRASEHVDMDVSSHYALSTTRSDRRDAERSGLASAYANFHHFSRHCLVMSGSEVLFDPAAALTPPPGMLTLRLLPKAVEWGLTFERGGN